MLIFLIFFLVLFSFILLCFITYRIAFYSSPKNRVDLLDSPAGRDYIKKRPELGKLVNGLKALPFEEVYITAKDGTRLFARYYHIADNAPLHIQCHGYRGSSLRDFCGGNKLARELGHNTLLIDQRAHGKSEGSAITFGINESKDILCWCEYAARRFGKSTPIILSGISMGASSVLMASRFSLPENVVGIIADCPYSSPGAIIRKVCKDMKFPPTLTYPFIVVGAKIFGGFNLSETTATGAVEKATVPILIIHGEADAFVPCSMSEDIYSCCREGTVFEKFEGAGHGMSYIVDPIRYTKITTAFIDTCMKVKGFGG